MASVTSQGLRLGSTQPSSRLSNLLQGLWNLQPQGLTFSLAMEPRFLHFLFFPSEGHPKTFKKLF